MLSCYRTAVSIHTPPIYVQANKHSPMLLVAPHTCSTGAQVFSGQASMRKPCAHQIQLYCCQTCRSAHPAASEKADPRGKGCPAEAAAVACGGVTSCCLVAMRLDRRVSIVAKRGLLAAAAEHPRQAGSGDAAAAVLRKGRAAVRTAGMLRRVAPMSQGAGRQQQGAAADAVAMVHAPAEQERPLLLPGADSHTPTPNLVRLW